ncbi:VRR-NUC domain-containing protein [Marinobacter sp. LV10R520-4]|uniref:VRR-NUC domain-containing protein n=1 Tax=Marinobacter sp. LV10R520-4 TaxID=1761796 RepID=UPI000BF85F66|nr:VRR-NUC domain-containing protein [Marinobacter sp. LV10R520-4]PFG52497.1 VRR-NUC domain-containing protein [Marinobacter sp. LV10R520-4]
MSKHHQDFRPAAANLENPLYYLENMETVVAWVANHHSDLLSAPENARLSEFLDLPRPARALLARMVMRSGELFRTDKLKYPELGSSEADALNNLIRDDWLDCAPLLTLDDLFRLFTLAELRPAFAPALVQAGFSKNLAKAQMRDVLKGTYADARTVIDWLGDSGSPVVRVSSMALFDRVRLMFFGNLRQSWSDFVLVELGHQRYEQVQFTSEARAFSERSQVDTYLAMHHCRECLDVGMPAAEVWAQVPQPSDNPWLSSRRDRLLLELGRQAERQGEREVALEALASSGHREARLKQLRLLERMKRFDEAWAIASDWQHAELSDAEAQGLARILKRLAAKVKQPAPLAPQPPPLDEFTLTLPQTGRSVERAVRDHLSSPEAPVFYMENTLINSLFGLLCWNTIFKPIPGAFFHPFHSGPADLLRKDFVSRRQAAFDQCFAALHDGGYRQQILNTYAAKQGITNPFVTWPALNEELLTLALDCIPALDLHILFERLLLNIREHRSGFPDLVRFYPENPHTRPRYEMIEVKGPGDRLQDHQVRWLHFFASKGIAASVCYLRWQTGEATP